MLGTECDAIVLQLCATAQRALRQSVRLPQACVRHPITIATPKHMRIHELISVSFGFGRAGHEILYLHSVGERTHTQTHAHTHAGPSDDARAKRIVQFVAFMARPITHNASLCHHSMPYLLHPRVVRAAQYFNERTVFHSRRYFRVSFYFFFRLFGSSCGDIVGGRAFPLFCPHGTYEQRALPSIAMYSHARVCVCVRWNS